MNKKYFPQIASAILALAILSCSLFTVAGQTGSFTPPVVPTWTARIVIQTVIATQTLEPISPLITSTSQAPLPTEFVTTPTTTCTQTIMAIDPANGTASTPPNVNVVVETVDNSGKSIKISAYYATTPVTAQILGMTHVNVWYGYCSLEAALEGAKSQIAERESEASIVGSWNYGYIVNETQPAAQPTTTCTQTIMAIDPANGTASTPPNVNVVVETVDNSGKSIKISAYYATTPVTAQILGMTHVNVWYGYCSLEAALEGAKSQIAERESEASIVGSWNYGYIVYPFGQ